MTDDPLLDSELAESFKAAHQALRKLAPPGTFTAGDDAYVQTIVDELEDLVRLARDTAAAHFGPTLSWVDARNDWAPRTLQYDFDDLTNDDPPEVSYIRWDDHGLDRAARAYRRECRWDHSPGEAGIWLVAVAPDSNLASSEGIHWRGSLTGFVILHDRDNDGEYESLAHVWTPQAWRGRGIAARLVVQARQRFPISQVEGPITPAGRALFEKCAPDLLT